ncbi:MAG: 3-dehydroquinate synthase family protein [Candidatus Krumholzibacteriota bacterium]
MTPDGSLILDMILDGHPSRYVLGPLACLDLGRFVAHPPPVYIMDATVAELHPRWLEQIQEGCGHFKHEALVVPGGETTKTLGRLAEVYDWLGSREISRDGTIVGVGGGAVLDLAGLAAATWRRGVNFVAIPTTLLAMVDASIGGKTALNAAGLKNPVGVFHPAAGILADCGFLATLPRGMWRDGLAEMVKTAIIGDPRLFAHLHHTRGRLADLLADGPADEAVHGILGALPWRQWIGQAATVKVRVVNQDFREQGIRRSLNLGHTLGHALEAWSHETDSPLSHGQAVAVGMAVVFRIATERGICPLETAVQVIELLEACGLPVSYACPGTEVLERLLAGDKKQSAREGLRWVLPERIGKMDIHGKVAVTEIAKWLD